MPVGTGYYSRFTVKANSSGPETYKRPATNDAAKGEIERKQEAVLHVVRGGAWLFDTADCHSASRNEFPGSTRANCVGFRVVVETN